MKHQVGLDGNIRWACGKPDYGQSLGAKPQMTVGKFTALYKEWDLYDVIIYKPCQWNEQ